MGAKKDNKSATKIQALARGAIARAAFRKKLADELKALKANTKIIQGLLKKAEEAQADELTEAHGNAAKELEEYRQQKLNERGPLITGDAVQDKLVDDSQKSATFQRQENMKLRDQNESIRKDFKELKVDNKRLMDINASTAESFEELNEQAKDLHANNQKTIFYLNERKQFMEQLKLDLKTRQSYYLAEAEAHSAYQKTMALIVEAVQDLCKDASLVEEVVRMALQCDEDAMRERNLIKAQARAVVDEEYSEDSEDSDY
jgi:hypothetical protein